MAAMRSASISEVKNGLSAIIDVVKAGEQVVITDRGVPVARIEPIASSDGIDGRIARLERAGVIRRGTRPPPVDLIRTPPPALAPGASAVSMLLEERAEGR
jgi:prevent-host-death family protein